MGNRTAPITLQLLMLVSKHLCDGIHSLSPRDLCPSAIPDQNAVVIFNSSCLEFVNVEQTWHAAQLECQTKGGNLVQIQNEDVQSFIMVTLKDLKWKRNGLWIGAHDIGREGQWEWMNGDTITWSNWEEGQPSCFYPKTIFCAEDCALLRYNSGGKWHDYRCNAVVFKYSYICQYDISRTTTNNGSESSPQALNSSVMTSTDLTPELKNTDEVTKSTPEYTINGTTVTATGFHPIKTGSAEDISTENSLNSTELDGISTTETVIHVTESQDNSSASTGKNTSPGDKGDNSSTEVDFVELETKSSLWVTAHFVISDDNYSTSDYDYNNLPSINAAHAQSTESKSIALTGPLLGSILGLCLISIIVVISFYYYKKRCRGGNATWSVGFDNPNYGSQEDSDCHAEREVECGETSR